MTSSPESECVRRQRNPEAHQSSGDTYYRRVQAPLSWSGDAQRGSDGRGIAGKDQQNGSGQEPKSIGRGMV
jgi:hypothetical protein